MTFQEEEKKVNIVDKRLRVCFVCTGNTCRSPMAAAVLNHLAPERFSAESAGLCASGRRDMSENAKAALREYGINPPLHISRQLDDGIVKGADIVIALTPSHLMVLMQTYPQYAEKFEAMKSVITDPYGSDLSVYKKCLDEIVKCIKERFSI